MTIKPFMIEIPSQRLASIRAKVEAFDWSDLPDAGGWSAGVGIKDLKWLVSYWLESFDWRTVERRLNRLPQFTTDIESERIHFIHVQGDGTKPPILLLHGWPGSFLEFEELIAPLADDGHDVVVPSLPGFAFSNPITGIIGPRRTSKLMHGLMFRLFGETRYVVQGGDWGAGIAGWMAHDHADALLGIHLNMVDVLTRGIVPETDEEKAFIARERAMLSEETGYSHLQKTRPQTLGVAMSDSPVGVAAWILEKFGNWSDLPKTEDGSPNIWGKYTEDQLLSNIMLYVGPPSFVTSTWMYRGGRLEGAGAYSTGSRIKLPVGVAAFPDPVFAPPPRSLAEKTFNIVRWTDMPAGGHFAAMEQPELMLGEIREFVKVLMERF